MRCRAARLGTLRVKSADMTQAFVEPKSPADLVVPPGARAESEPQAQARRSVASRSQPCKKP